MFTNLLVLMMIEDLFTLGDQVDGKPSVTYHNRGLLLSCHRGLVDEAWCLAFFRLLDMFLLHGGYN